MSRVIKVGVVFEFYPDTEHADMFTDEEGAPVAKTEEELIATCKDLAFEDISNIVFRGELWDSMSVDVLQEAQEEGKMSKSPIWLDDFEKEVLRGYLGELLDSKEVPDSDIEALSSAYNQTLEE